ncbi:MAG: heavy metal sensor histidine kinase [Planctomycetes bacterium]|nr:heavy metal sensor histidine kinase [Planctomycetota bacterium]
MSAGPRRVRLRLAAWSTAVFAFVLIAVGFVVASAFTRALVGQAEERVDAHARRFERLLRDELDGRTDVEELVDELREEADLAWYAVQVAGWPRIASAEWERARDARLDARVGADGTGAAPTDDVIAVASDLALRVASRSFAVGDVGVRFAVGIDERPVRESLASFRAILWIVGPLALMVAFVGGYWLAGRLLAPVRVLAEAAERITVDRLRERLPVRGESDEFDRVAMAFNAVLVRLEAAFERQRRFTADASHELRTPLTAMRTVAEVELRERRAGEPVATREALCSMLEEIDRLTTLIDRLLMLTRADANVAPARLEPADLTRVARDVAATLEPIADERGIELTCAGDRAVVALADPDGTRRSVLNLVDNALRHTPRGGRVTIRCATRGSQATIEVADTGVGIAAEHHERVFERFFRADPSRTSATDGRGAGLGLAIAKAGVEACGGRIELASELGRGATFTIVLASAPPV